ncbi:MAG TPA: signal peptidase II [Gemmatimonadaceae bacterium]
MERSNPNPRLFFGVVASVVLADAVTKIVAMDRLVPSRVPREVLGETLRFTLVFNSGAAFGLHFGPWSRWIFTALTLGALAVLWELHRSTRAGDRVRTLALALVSGGAVGNLVDRLKSGRGVVDFIDVGVGGMRWPTFNVADMAVSCGAVLLAIVLWREDAAEKGAAPAVVAASDSDPAVQG